MKRMTLVWTLLGAMLVSMALSGCEKRPESSEGTPQEATGKSAAGTAAKAPASAYNFTLAIYDSPGNAFWNKVQAGAREAAAKLGCNVLIQFGEGNQTKLNDVLETAISKKADGIGVTINYDDAYDETISKARGAGIPVIAFNIDDSKGAAGNARMAYIGQKMEEAGYIIAKRLIKDGGLKKGDFVLCPVETPGAVYAIQRYAGAKKAFDEAGILSQVIENRHHLSERNPYSHQPIFAGPQGNQSYPGHGANAVGNVPQCCQRCGLENSDGGV